MNCLWRQFLKCSVEANPRIFLTLVMLYSGSVIAILNGNKYYSNGRKKDRKLSIYLIKKQAGICGRAQKINTNSSHKEPLHSCTTWVITAAHQHCCRRWGCWHVSKLLPPASEGWEKVLFFFSLLVHTQGRGYPHPSDEGGGEITWPGPRRGDSPHQAGWGYPPGQDGVNPPATGRQSSRASSCYKAGGMPLAFTQRTLLFTLLSEESVTGCFQKYPSSHQHWTFWEMGQVVPFREKNQRIASNVWR